MRTDVAALIEIPCFKCLFWDWKKESHLHCNPCECEELTKWLLKQVEEYQKHEESLTVVATQQVKASEEPKL